MDGGKKLHALTLIASVVDTNVKPLFRKLGIAHLRPCFTPMFQRFGTAPVGSGNGIEHILTVCVSNTVALLVQHIFSPLFYAPCAVLLHWSNRAEKVKMGIGCAAVLTLLFVKGHINGHAPADKLPKQKFPCQSDVFFKRKFILQGNFKTVCKLGVLTTLGFFNCVP